MPPALPVDFALSEQLHIGLVDQGSGLQAIAAPLGRQLSRRQRAKLGVDDGDQPIQGFAAATLPLPEQMGDARRRLIAWVHEMVAELARQLSTKPSLFVPTELFSRCSDKCVHGGDRRTRHSE